MLTHISPLLNENFKPKYIDISKQSARKNESHYIINLYSSVNEDVPHVYVNNLTYDDVQEIITYYWQETGRYLRNRYRYGRIIAAHFDNLVLTDN